MSDLKAPIIGIERHRIVTDGEGVTTLVGFWGCPLKCRYCLNPQSWKEGPKKYYTPEELYELVSIDNLYFLATNGGVTFGGGEPLLYSDFISAFRDLCGEEWNICLETSLNVPLANLQQITPIIDHYYVDIKELNDDIYQAYTGKSNLQALKNLEWLGEQVDKEKITVRLPLIPSFNNENNILESEKRLKSMGFNLLNKFTYRTDDHINKV